MGSVCVCKRARVRFNCDRSGDGRDLPLDNGAAELNTRMRFGYISASMLWDLGNIREESIRSIHI
jgi:hypothetical protein